MSHLAQSLKAIKDKYFSLSSDVIIKSQIKHGIKLETITLHCFNRYSITIYTCYYVGNQEVGDPFQKYTLALSETGPRLYESEPSFNDIRTQLNFPTSLCKVIDNYHMVALTVKASLLLLPFRSEDIHYTTIPLSHKRCMTSLINDLSFYFHKSAMRSVLSDIELSPPSRLLPFGGIQFQYVQKHFDRLSFLENNQ